MYYFFALECTPKAFWFIARHGFRNPGDDEIIELQLRGEEIKEAILQNKRNGKPYPIIYQVLCAKTKSNVNQKSIEI